MAGPQKKKRKRALTFSGEVVQLFEVCIREEQVKGNMNINNNV